MESLIAPAFLVGLMSTVHCLGMCGGIAGALTLSLRPDIRTSRSRMLPFVSAYNLGRISSYVVAGAIGGGLGGALFDLISPHYGRQALQYLAAAMMIAIGFYLAGWFPRFAALERLGAPLWRRLEPLGRRFLPVRSPVHAYLFGLVWGWLPCGLVYSSLIWTTTSGSAFNGALFMLAFGAGTLPAVMTAGVVTGWVTRLSRAPYARTVAGTVIIIMGLASLWLMSRHGMAPAPEASLSTMEV